MVFKKWVSEGGGYLDGNLNGPSREVERDNGHSKRQKDKKFHIIQGHMQLLHIIYISVLCVFIFYLYICMRIYIGVMYCFEICGYPEEYGVPAPSVGELGHQNSCVCVCVCVWLCVTQRYLNINYLIYKYWSRKKKEERGGKKEEEEYYWKRLASEGVHTPYGFACKHFLPWYLRIRRCPAFITIPDVASI